MARRLTEAEVTEGLGSLEGWELRDGKLHKKYKLSNFVEAFGFLTRIALEAEKMDHHPELFNVYSNVHIDLTTHDCQGISEKDFALARRIDAVR